MPVMRLLRRKRSRHTQGEKRKEKVSKTDCAHAFCFLSLKKKQNTYARIMKTAQDPRHQKRITRMQELFSYSFGNPQKGEHIQEIRPLLPKIDEMIGKAAPEWPVEKIAKIDLAILRLALFEITQEKQIPFRVVIDEAVELAKSFGNPNSPKFINGVLGTIVQNI